MCISFHRRKNVFWYMRVYTTHPEHVTLFMTMFAVDAHTRHITLSGGHADFVFQMIDRSNS